MTDEVLNNWKPNVLAQDLDEKVRNSIHMKEVKVLTFIVRV